MLVDVDVDVVVDEVDECAVLVVDDTTAPDPTAEVDVEVVELDVPEPRGGVGKRQGGWKGAEAL